MEDALQPCLWPWQPAGSADRGPEGPTLSLPSETELILRIDEIHTGVEAEQKWVVANQNPLSSAKNICLVL